MKKMLKIVLALVLVAALMATSGCAACMFTAGYTAAALAHPSPAPSAAPAAVAPDDSSPVYERLVFTPPDLETLESELNDLLEDVESGGDTTALFARYDAVRALYDSADSASQIAYLLYAQDVTEDTYWDAYLDITDALLELDLIMTDVSISLFDSSEEAGALARARYGDGYVDTVYATAPLNSEDVVELLAADNALQGEYDTLLSGFTFTDGGRAWSYDDIQADETLGYDKYIHLYERYCAELNAEAGPLFLELLALRAETAQKLGYGNYAAYRYDCYGRDYTVIDAQALHAAVKAHIVPVFISAYTRAEDVYDLYNVGYDEGMFFQDLSAALADDPRCAEALSVMLDEELIDLAVSDKKMESSFTIYFTSMQRPFIFSQWENDSYSIDTVLHEFGHFMNYYFNPSAGWCSGDSLDLAEVDSQAFVLLMAPKYAALYGEDYAEAALMNQLLDALYAIVSGCMEDEFQQRVYADPSMTLEEINALYAQLAAAYGMDEVYGYTGTEWTLIPHTFQSPMYYISYAVSMLSAVEIWSGLSADADAARGQYWGVLMRDPYAPFRDSLKGQGVADPFSEAAVKRMAALIDENIA